MALSAEPVLPPPAPEAAAHSRLLAELIASTILDAGGWIPFERYMELALYAAGQGYYAAGARKFGSEGDFVTAPEISPLFARCIAMQARQVLEAVAGDILELGPGSGALAADLYGELKAQGKVIDGFTEDQRSTTASTKGDFPDPVSDGRVKMLLSYP